MIVEYECTPLPLAVRASLRLHLDCKFERWVTGGLTTVGISADSSGSGYRFAAGTGLWPLGVSALVLLLYVLLMRSPRVDAGKPLSGVVRRYFAFWLDFVLAMIILTPIIGILPTDVEWKRTHVFMWGFERTTQMPTDAPLAALSGLVGFGALLFYYATLD